MKSSATRNTTRVVRKRPAFVVPAEPQEPEPQKCDCAPDEDSFHPDFRNATDKWRNE